jgi:hypothetical protein
VITPPVWFGSSATGPKSARSPARGHGVDDRGEHRVVVDELGGSEQLPRPDLRVEGRVAVHAGAADDRAGTP